MNNMRKGLLGGLLFAAMTSLFIFMFSLDNNAKASQFMAAELVDSAGNAIPGAIPINVIIDLTNSVPTDSTQWKLIKTFECSEFAQRVTWAGGIVDAGFSNTSALTYTMDVPSLVTGAAVETQDILVKVTTKFSIDGGTALLDVGISGATEQFAKDVSVISTAGTRVLGSATTSVKPRLVDSNAVPGFYRLTFTESTTSWTSCTAESWTSTPKTDPSRKGANPCSPSRTARFCSWPPTAPPTPRVSPSSCPWW